MDDTNEEREHEYEPFDMAAYRLRMQKKRQACPHCRDEVEWTRECFAWRMEEGGGLTPVAWTDWLVECEVCGGDE